MRCLYTSHDYPLTSHTVPDMRVEMAKILLLFYLVSRNDASYLKSLCMSVHICVGVHTLYACLWWPDVSLGCCFLGATNLDFCFISFSFVLL